MKAQGIKDKKKLNKRRKKERVISPGSGHAEREKSQKAQFQQCLRGQNEKETELGKEGTRSPGDFEPERAAEDSEIQNRRKNVREAFLRQSPRH